MLYFQIEQELDLDFPESLRISKGKGQTLESAPKNTSPKLNARVPISASEKAGPMQREVKAAPVQTMCKNKVLIMIWTSMETLDLLGFATVQRMEFASKFVSDSDRDTTDVDDIPEKTAGDKDMCHGCGLAGQ